MKQGKLIMRILLPLSLASLAVLSVISCRHIPEMPAEPSGSNNQSHDTTGSNPNPPATGDTSYYYNARACFQRDILPIIQTNCAIPGCHDGSSSGGDDRTQESLIALTNYSQIMNIVVPNDPSSSRLYRAITGSGEDHMPPQPQPPLSTAQVDSIYDWIRYDALNEDCCSLSSTNGCDTSQVSFSATVWPIIQNYCLGCHTGPNAQLGILLDNYQDISAVASSGKLMDVLKAQSGYPIMPPAGSLSACQISQIAAWIHQGSPNSRVVQ